MEKCLLVTVTACVLIIACTTAGLAAILHGNSEDSAKHYVGCNVTTTSTTPTPAVCLTQGCVSAAATLLERINEKINPCDDFFQFSCGKYLANQIIPDDKSSISQFSDIGDELKEKLRTLVDSDITAADTVTSKMLKTLYKSCMNTDKIAKDGLAPLKAILKEMGGWPVLEGDTWNNVSYSWIQNIFTNRKIGYSIDYIVDFSVTVNIKNSTWRVIDIDQPPLGMPSRKYLLKGFNDSDVQAYYNYQLKVAQVLGADPEIAKRDLRETLDFEIKIANFSLPKEERRNVTKLYNKMTIKQLQQMSPAVPWLKYINTVLQPYFNVTSDEVIIVNVPSYMRNLSRLLEETPTRTIANYILWRVTASSISYMTEELRNIQLEYSKILTGKATRAPRWKECMGAVKGSLSHAMGSMYAKKVFKEEAKASADEMVGYIRNQFNIILQNIEWMDEKTRSRALNKSKAITSHIAYPKELLVEQNLIDLYDGLTITNGSLLSNMRNMTIFGTNYSFRRLREKVDKNDWKNHGAAAVVNAFYSPLENSIQFPAGILQGIFFNANRPKYMNFGGIGFVIGHEITHGFDDTGRQFDEVGDLNDWWESETKEKFINKSKCIIWQYGNYSVPSLGMNLNGINTQGENIADNGGIKQAYYAYDQWALDHGAEDPLPSLNYTVKQLFWISAANIWCGKYRPETLKLRILTGFHSPAEFRVNVPFGNLPEFSKDWNCPVGSKMNPVKKCAVW